MMAHKNSIQHNREKKEGKFEKTNLISRYRNVSTSLDNSFSLTDLPIRGSIEQMSSYLGSVQLTAEEFVKHKPQVPLGLLKALGLHANAVSLPTENSATFLKSAVKQLVQITDTKKLAQSEFVVTGTESIIDGSLPLSNHVLDLIPTRHVMSSEQKHACIATMNAIWDKCRDTGIVAATDIAHYASDNTTAASAEFTGGAGAVAMFTQEGSQGQLLDILDVKGFSSSLTYDFYKPYQVKQHEINAKNYPVVFGKYSNLANYERVTDAYLNLKMNLWIKGVDFSLQHISGIVLHTPYPGITKYNLAMLALVDLIPAELIDVVDDQDLLVYMDEIDRYNDMQKGSVIIYQYISRLIRQAHQAFSTDDLTFVGMLESEVKSILRDIIKDTQNSPAISILGCMDGCDLLEDIHARFTKHMNKLKPSLSLISQVGNIYTGSSPLCMMSWLEEADYGPNEYILWGGYGSGNQALFMLAKTKLNTKSVALEWRTQDKLASRIPITAQEYEWIQSKSGMTYEEILHVLNDANYISPELVGDHVIIPNGYYITSCNQYQQAQLEIGELGQILEQDLMIQAMQAMQAIDRMGIAAD